MTGIISMATGTGKTYVGLYASKWFIEHAGDSPLVVVLVPYSHLAHHWAVRFCRELALSHVLPAVGGMSWNEVVHHIKKLIIGKIDSLVIIMTYRGFTNRAGELSTYLPYVNALLIADEAHWFGIPSMRKSPAVDVFKAYLGLSATPERTWDDAGNAFISLHLGDIVYEMSLKDALTQINEHTGKTYLTPYHYELRLAFMSSDEWEKYLSFTRKIAQQLNRYYELDEEEENLTIAAAMRALHMISIKDKLRELKAIAGEIAFGRSIIFTSYMLYADVMRLLQQEKIPFHRIDQHDSVSRRLEKIDDFSRGKVRALVAMNVLDEGLDVSGADTAVFVSMPASPRRFIQRLGRVIRRDEGKDMAVVYDIVSLPPTYVSAGDAERLLKPQISRIYTLSSHSVGGYMQYLDFMKKIEQIYGGDMAWI